MSTRLSASERREGILRAATAVFAESNYRAARVAAIAAEAGVSEPLLYKYFPSKKALFCEILERVGTRILEIWQEALVDAPDGLAALEKACAVYIANLQKHPAEAALQFQALAEVADPEIAAVLRDNHRRYIEYFEDLLTGGQREGVIRKDIDARVGATILDGVGFTLTLTRLLDLGYYETQLDPMIAALLDWFAQPSETERREEET